MQAGFGSVRDSIGTCMGPVGMDMGVPGCGGGREGRGGFVEVGGWWYFSFFFLVWGGGGGGGGGLGGVWCGLFDVVVCGTRGGRGPRENCRGEVGVGLRGKRG